MDVSVKWTAEIATNQVIPMQKPNTLGVIITERINLYQHLGWLSEVSDEDVSVLIKDSETTEQRIIAAGLNPKPQGTYRIGIIPACFSVLHPHTMRWTLCNLLDQQDHSEWGYVNTHYYGEWGEQKDIPHGFAPDDIGKVFFLVEDEDAPNRNDDMPGSLLANMRWDEARDNAWAEWKQKFEVAGTIKALNYASHGLIWLGDIADWQDALGRVGVYDYIEQPYDVGRYLCPFGCVHDREAEWNVYYAIALPSCAVAAVVW